MTFKSSIKLAVRGLTIVSITIIWCLNAHAYQVSRTPSGQEIKWRISTATYWINTAGGPWGSLEAIQASMQTWSDVATASFNFVYGGPTTSTDWGINDGVNIVCFGPMDSTGTLAVNKKWYHGPTGEVLDSDIKLNTDYVYKTDGAADAFDVQNIATHELGHSLSLNDLYGIFDSDKTMYGYAAPGEIKKRTLAQDDKDGISYLYPQGAGPSGTLPVYRFCNTTTGTYFYTINEAEKENILKNYPHFRYEGIAWYAYPP